MFDLKYRVYAKFHDLSIGGTLPSGWNDFKASLKSIKYKINNFLKKENQYKFIIAMQHENSWTAA